MGPPLGSLVIVGKDNNSIGLYEIYSIDEVSFIQHDRINFVDMGPKQIAFCRGVSCVFILPMTGVKRLMTIQYTASGNELDDV